MNGILYRPAGCWRGDESQPSDFSNTKSDFYEFMMGLKRAGAGGGGVWRRQRVRSVFPPIYELMMALEGQRGVEGQLSVSRRLLHWAAFSPPKDPGTKEGGGSRGRRLNPFPRSSQGSSFQILRHRYQG